MTAMSHQSGLEPKSSWTLASLLPLIVIQQTLGALSFPITKYGLTQIEPFTFAFYRFILSSVILLVLARLQNQAIPIERKDYSRILLLGILIIPLNQTLYLLGQSMTAAGHGAVLFATTPIWVFVMAIFILKEKLVWRRVLGIAVAIVGVACIMLNGALRIGTQYVTGDLIIFCSVWAWGLYTILGKPMAEKYGALRVTAYALASGSALYTPFGLYRALHYDYSQASIGAWLTVVYMALGASVVAYVLWYFILKHMAASRLAVFSNSQPIIATTVAYFTIGERLGWPFFIGAAIVLVGVLITEL